MNLDYRDLLYRMACHKRKEGYYVDSGGHTIILCLQVWLNIIFAFDDYTVCNHCIGVIN